MQVSLLQILTSLSAGIALIVLLTVRYKVHAFFALVVASLVVGMCVKMHVNEIIATVKDGFGSIMKSLGLLIVLGTTLGILLEYSGSTRVMADQILKLTGAKRAPLAMSITGFIVGLPIFCDSGYIVLSGLNNAVSKRTAVPVTVMAPCLATGLYAVHCMVPPHPGVSAAAGIIGIEFGPLMLSGVLVAIPGMIAGYCCSVYAGKNNGGVAPIPGAIPVPEDNSGKLPGVWQAFLPVVMPIVLIALKAFITVKDSGSVAGQFLVVGDPVIALSIGLLLVFITSKNLDSISVARLLQEGAEKAGGILVIIGAGGAFGALLAATKIGDHLGSALPLAQLGLFFPFLLTAVIKTAQGSSTVAIITASSIVLPLLPALGLNAHHGPMLTVLAMSAGSMLISHSNDAYFWVISRFSGLKMRPMLKIYSLSTLLMGIVAYLSVYILSKII